ncbi:MAG TPA: hypothetical protein VGN64_06385 [Dyadobacter sp.]|nr:hypothetical protein [Dyadobacter sp.]
MTEITGMVPPKYPQGIQKLTSNVKYFQFLHEEEQVYSIDDLKEVYNG